MTALLDILVVAIFLIAITSAAAAAYMVWENQRTDEAVYTARVATISSSILFYRSFYLGFSSGMLELAPLVIVSVVAWIIISARTRKFQADSPE